MIMAGIMVAAMETIEVTRTSGGAGEGADGAVVTITLNRPEKKNAINGVMWDELLATFREIAQGDDRVVVLTGTGGAFCSGADLSGRRRGHRLAPAAPAGRHAPCRRRGAGPAPPAAAHHRQGRWGGSRRGANMAFSCDLIVAADDARFTEIFARRGLTIDFGGSWVLPRLVGLHKAKELAFFADIISAKEAEALGVVNRVVPAGELDAFVDDWARRLALGPPITLAQTKRLLNNAMAVTMEQALEGEGTAQTVELRHRGHRGGHGRVPGRSASRTSRAAEPRRERPGHDRARTDRLTTVRPCLSLVPRLGVGRGRRGGARVAVVLVATAVGALLGAAGLLDHSVGAQEPPTTVAPVVPAVPVDPAATLPVDPAATAPPPSQVLPSTTNLVPLNCTPIAPPFLVFAGRITAYQVPTFRFKVDQVVAGTWTGPWSTWTSRTTPGSCASVRPTW